jgi:hypothetical protein
MNMLKNLFLLKKKFNDNDLPLILDYNMILYNKLEEFHYQTSFFFKFICEFIY